MPYASNRVQKSPEASSMALLSASPGGLAGALKSALMGADGTVTVADDWLLLGLLSGDVELTTAVFGYVPACSGAWAVTVMVATPSETRLGSVKVRLLPLTLVVQPAGACEFT